MKKGKRQLISIAFYNLENLFDLEDDPHTFDDDFLPHGSKKWDLPKYEKKLSDLSKIIAQLGSTETQTAPALVGLAEVENEHVIQDLLQSNPALHHYEWIHFESQDERGIDVGLIYNPHLFTLEKTEFIPFSFPDPNGIDYTRDILCVDLCLYDTKLRTYVLHLPSRRNQNVNQEKREEILLALQRHIGDFAEQNPETAILIMGDFNMDPDDDSLRIIGGKNIQNFGSLEFRNPYSKLFEKGIGSLKHKDQWHLFDQILFSQHFFSKENEIQHAASHVENKEDLQDQHPDHLGKPFRTYAGSRYLGGFSDHFPIFSLLYI